MSRLSRCHLVLVTAGEPLAAMWTILIAIPTSAGDCHACAINIYAHKGEVSVDSGPFADIFRAVHLVAAPVVTVCGVQRAAVMQVERCITGP